MKTEHVKIFSNSSSMKQLSDESVDLIVTSPPYPMIEMWDEMFSELNPLIKDKMDLGEGFEAYELMHKLLDLTWLESYRVLKPGGFACINIGDATRTIKGNFVLYTNHARILNFTQKLGFSSLPCILWRKQTNAPNKFMGSGMLPAGAYVTLEHEYVLILRKGSKRIFKSAKDKGHRRKSALFWEERNTWFSDMWFDIKGTSQALNDKDTRKRSAAYPFDLVYRLINMYSAKEDVVLDPFLGMGTTTLAAMVSGRNSIGFEIDESLLKANKRLQKHFIETSQEIIHKRLLNHVEFVHNRMETHGSLKHKNLYYGFPVMTAQEKDLLINDPAHIDNEHEKIMVSYAETPQNEFCLDWSDSASKVSIKAPKKIKKASDQLDLF